MNVLNVNIFIEIFYFNQLRLDKTKEKKILFTIHFLFFSLKEDYELRVKIVSSTYWPDACSPLKASFNLINTIRKLRMNIKSNGPIVVHDLFGGHRAG
jgi:hypothetical protein